MLRFLFSAFDMFSANISRKRRLSFSAFFNNSDALS